MVKTYFSSNEAVPRWHGGMVCMENLPRPAERPTGQTMTVATPMIRSVSNLARAHLSFLHRCFHGNFRSDLPLAAAAVSMRNARKLGKSQPRDEKQ
jgi:hypothetical protein